MCVSKNQLDHDCPVCGGGVYGRSDKIYCSISCKNRHHAQTRRQNKPVTVVKNQKLERNYTILQGLLGGQAKGMQISVVQLAKLGFDFSSATGACLTAESTIVFECYRFYYLIRDGVVYVKESESMTERLPGVFERWFVDFPEDLKVVGNQLGAFPNQNGKQNKSG